MNKGIPEIRILEKSFPVIKAYKYFIRRNTVAAIVVLFALAFARLFVFINASSPFWQKLCGICHPSEKNARRKQPIPRATFT